MKYFAVVISFYILTMSALPVMVMLHEEFSSCEMKCGATKLPKERDCAKACCYFCCYNPIVMFPHAFKYSIPFSFELKNADNFGHAETFQSLRAFDIWHPPRST